MVFWVSSSSATAWPTLLKPMWQRSGKCKRESRLPALVKENATKTRVFGAFGCFARVPFFFLLRRRFEEMQDVFINERFFFLELAGLKTRRNTYFAPAFAGLWMHHLMCQKS